MGVFPEQSLAKMLKSAWVLRPEGYDLKSKEGRFVILPSLL
jgi:hypothetical protein